MSLIRAHQKAWQKKASTQHQNRGVPETASPGHARSGDAVYQTWQSQCATDWKTLKALPKGPARDAKKPGFLDTYRDYLRGVLDSGEPETNDVLLRNIVIAADVQQWDWLLEMADFAIENGMDMELIGFKSDVSTFVSDTVRNWAEQYYKDTQTKRTGDDLAAFKYPPVFHDVMSRVNDGDWDINFVSLAKFNKFAGLEAESNQHWEKAVQYYTEANKYPNVGVKTRLENAERQLDKIQ